MEENPYYKRYRIATTGMKRMVLVWVAKCVVIDIHTIGRLQIDLICNGLAPTKGNKIDRSSGLAPTKANKINRSSGLASTKANKINR